MPDVVTHYYFGRELFKKLNPDTQKQITNLGLYDFATAGPDPFFFVHFLNKEKQKASHQFGNYMHTNQVCDFFVALTEEAKKTSEMFSYLCGFIAHFALDVFFHPYVFYSTGLYQKENPDSKSYRGLHTKLERALDTDIITMHFKKKAHRFKIHKHVLKLKKLDPILKDSFDRVYQVFGKEDGFTHVSTSLRYQRKFYRFIYDPFGMKQKLFERIDNGTSELDFTFLSYYNKNISNIDIWNQSHSPWLNPANESLCFTQSVFDLFEEATLFASRLIVQAYEYVFLDKEVNLFKLYPDLSYLTGLPLQQNQEMKFFKNMFLKN